MRCAWFVVLACIATTGCHDDTNCHEENCPSPATTTGSGAGGGAPSLAEQYCNCMLTSCHDEYHATFGPDTDEPAARANCMSTAEALPVAGMSVEQGNFIECRIHHCELGHNDPSACASSVGQDACAP